MLRMGTESANAKALYAFLEQEWARMGIRPTAWCRKVGLADATVLRWREGIEPDLRSLKRVAEALERPLIDILVGARYVTSEEAGGYVVAPRCCDLLEAIRLDPELSDGEREALRQVHDAFALVEAERAHRTRSRRRTSALS